jgi:hypothetical protein
MKRVLILSFHDCVQNDVIHGNTTYRLTVVLIKTCLRFIKMYLEVICVL